MPDPADVLGARLNLFNAFPFYGNSESFPYVLDRSYINGGIFGHTTFDGNTA